MAHAALAADPDPDYLGMVDAAAAKPAEARWCDIRARYPDTSFYRAHLGLQIKKVTMEAGQKMIDEKTKDSVASFRDFMRKNAAAVGAHYYAAYIYKWNNDLVKQKMEGLLPDFGHGVDYIDPKFEKAAGDELLKCILRTGDGRTQKTSYQVVTVDEAEVLIDKYYNVNPVALENVKAGGHVYYVITIEIPDSRLQEKLYFQLDDRLVRGAIAADLAEKLKLSLPKKTP
jgi:hypothetical protein